jgi:protoheme IX farnesyltransferase
VKISTGTPALPGRLALARLLDYATLMKPELTGLSVLTTLCGFFLASDDGFRYGLFFWTALGTLLVGGGLGALNQYVERHYDAMMRRTERRPLPAGRLSPVQALWFGVGCLVCGVGILLAATNTLTALLAVVIIATYLFLYTPLKRLTRWSTVIGGIPGALPPVMGWTAAGGDLDSGALILFSILFLWQLPHFYALAWMYRKDYARAGFRMLTVEDEDASKTSRHVFWSIVGLVPVSIVLTLVGVTGWKYALVAFLLGVPFLIYAMLFLKFSGYHFSAAKVNYYSRQLFFASLWYLPVLMFSMIIDKF